MSAYFGEFIQVWAQQRPNKSAIQFQGTEYSYFWLEQQVRHANRWLSDQRVGPGDRVAFIGFNHPLMLVLLFALARNGAILVPLNYRLTAFELSQQIIDSEPVLLVADESFFELAQSLAIPVRPLVELEALGGDQPNHSGASLLPDEYKGNKGTLDDDLLLVYTSGTTGAPKGAVLTQNALLWNCFNSIHAHDLVSTDRVLIALPMFHVGGLNIMLTPALYVGATLAIEAKFEPSAFLSLVHTWRPTLSILVPATITALIKHPSWFSTDVSSLRLINTGSSIVPKELLEAWHQRGIPAAQVYGSTETAPIAIYLRQEDTERKLGSAGLAALHCHVMLINKDGHSCAVNEVGEILVKGPNVMRRYWRNPECTRESFSDDWFKTGDLAYQDPDGFYWVVGRCKDMIISGGENIYPAEIEMLIAEHKDVVECAVVGLADERWGEVPVLVVVLVDGADTAMLTSLLEMQLTGRLAKFKWPKQVHSVKSFTKTALGKIRKDELKKALLP
jgi:fatty-acyl-CoA synthase